jgi:TetR/AcrR family transcriptional repressor of nem operon
VPPLQRLRRHFDRISKLYADTDFTRNCILGGFSAELANQSEAIRESLRKLYLQWTKDIEATVAEAQAKGEIANETKASDIAAFLLDAYEGALLRARVERSPSPLERECVVGPGRTRTANQIVMKWSRGGPSAA